MVSASGPPRCRVGRQYKEGKRWCALAGRPPVEPESPQDERVDREGEAAQGAWRRPPGAGGGPGPPSWVGAPGCPCSVACGQRPRACPRLSFAADLSGPCCPVLPTAHSPKDTCPSTGPCVSLQPQSRRWLQHTWRWECGAGLDPVAALPGATVGWPLVSWGHSQPLPRRHWCPLSWMLQADWTQDLSAFSWEPLPPCCPLHWPLAAVTSGACVRVRWGCVTRKNTGLPGKVLGGVMGAGARPSLTTALPGLRVFCAQAHLTTSLL